MLPIALTSNGWCYYGNCECVGQMTINWWRQSARHRNIIFEFSNIDSQFAYGWDWEVCDVSEIYSQRTSREMSAQRRSLTNGHQNVRKFQFSDILPFRWKCICLHRTPIANCHVIRFLFLDRSTWGGNLLICANCMTDALTNTLPNLYRLRHSHQCTYARAKKKFKKNTNSEQWTTHEKLFAKQTRLII